MKIDIDPRVGELIRNSRTANELTLREVSDLIGVSVAYLSDVEHGRRPVRSDRLYELTEIVGMSESHRRLVFQYAKLLPPSVFEAVLDCPELWATDVKLLLKGAAAAREQLKGTSTGRVLNQAFKQVGW